MYWMSVVYGTPFARPLLRAGKLRRRAPNGGIQKVKPQVEAPRSSAVEGVDAVISAWVANECNRVLIRELSEEAEAAHADFVREAKGEELDVWGFPKVPKPHGGGGCWQVGG